MTLNSDFFHGSGFRPLTVAEQVAASGYTKMAGSAHESFEYYVVVPSSEANFFDFSQSEDDNVKVLAEGYSSLYGFNYLYPADKGGLGYDGDIKTPHDDIEFFERSGVYMTHPSNYLSQVHPDAASLRASPKVLPTGSRMSDTTTGFDGLNSNLSKAPSFIPSTMIDDFTVFEGYVHYLRDNNNQVIKINYKDLLYKINRSLYNTYVGSLDLNETFASEEDKSKLGRKNKDFMVKMEGSGWFIKRQAWGPEPSGLPVNPNDGKNPLLGVDPCPGSVEKLGAGTTFIDKGKTITVLCSLKGLTADDIISVKSSDESIFTTTHAVSKAELSIVVTAKLAREGDIEVSYKSTCGKDENEIESYYKGSSWKGDKFLTKVKKLPVRVIGQPDEEDDEEDDEDGVACTDYGWASYGDALSLTSRGKIKIGEVLDLYSILPFVKKVVDVTASAGLDLKKWERSNLVHYYKSVGSPYLKNSKSSSDWSIRADWQIRGVKAGMYTINFTVDAYCYDKSKIGSKNRTSSRYGHVDEKKARIRNEFGSYKTVSKIYVVQIEVK